MTTKTQPAPNHVKGWILDAYPAGEGEITVWIISENGKRIKLDRHVPIQYLRFNRQDELERLFSRLYNNQLIASTWIWLPFPHRPCGIWEGAGG